MEARVAALIVSLAGRYAYSGTETWLLPLQWGREWLFDTELNLLSWHPFLEPRQLP